MGSLFYFYYFIMCFLYTITINNFYGCGWSVTGTVADGILTIASPTVGG